MDGKAKIERADAQVARKSAALGETGTVKALGTLSDLADQPQLYSICGATIVLGAVTRNVTLARTGVRMLAAEWLATQLKTVVKRRVDRLRPEAAKDADDNALTAGDSEDHDRSSFPSGHTAGALAVARALRHEYPASQKFALPAAALVAAVQVPRGKHYLSDLVAGAAIGLVAEGLVNLTERALTRRDWRRSARSPE